MGSMVHDVATMVGAIVLIFIMMYMLMIFGTRATADMLNSGPLVIEEALAGHLAIASMASGNASISFIPRVPMDLKIEVTTDIIFVEPPDKYVPYGEVERGAVVLKTPEPLSYIKLKGIDVKEKRRIFVPQTDVVKEDNREAFDKTYSISINTEKTNLKGRKELTIDVR